MSSILNVFPNNKRDDSAAAVFIPLLQNLLLNEESKSLFEILNCVKRKIDAEILEQNPLVKADFERRLTRLHVEKEFVNELIDYFVKVKEYSRDEHK